jgi:hypothetical protein
LFGGCLRAVTTPSHDRISKTRTEARACSIGFAGHADYPNYQESSGAYLYASMPVRGKGDGGWRRGLQCSYPFRRRGKETPYG